MILFYLFSFLVIFDRPEYKKIVNKHQKILYENEPFEQSYDFTTEEEEDLSGTYSEELYDMYYEEMREQNRVNKRKLHCIHRNTRYNEELEQCECFPGFPYGDPESKPGCWRCENVCHQNAVCRYPGRCVCPRGYHGDGISRCDKITLNLLNINQTVGKASGNDSVLLKYEYKNGRKTKAMFCRFGSTYVQAESFTESTILCKTPHLMPGTYKVAISYNGDMWSKSNFTFKFVDDDEYDNVVLIIAIIAFVFISIIVFSFYSVGTGMIKPTKSETEPFIKNDKKNLNGVRNRRNFAP